MYNLTKRLKNKSLFFTLATIMLISSVSISIITAISIMNISKKIFINNFSISSTKILKQIQANSSDLNDKIISTINTVNNSWAFRRYFSENITDPSELFYVTYNLQQHIKINEQLLNDNYIEMLLVGKNNTIYISNSSLLTTPVSVVKNNVITKIALKNPYRVLYQYNNHGFTSLTKNDSAIVATKVLYDQLTKSPFGVIYMTINEKVFKKLYSNFTTTGNDVAVISSNGTVVSSSINNMIGSKNYNLLNLGKEIKKNHIKYLNITLNKKKCIILSEYMPIYDFYLVNIIDTNKALSDMYNTKQIILICSIIIFITFSILFMVTRKTTAPLRILVKEMSKITECNFNNHINLKGSPEITKLSSSFNYMLDSLNDYVEKLMLAQKKQRKAELSALQMQINPHFIYNTLASIKWLMLKGDKEKTGSTIDSFISLLQNTISDTSETVTVEKEILNLKNYVFINEMRYGEKIKVNFHVFPQCNEYKLPKLMLQPFIENAFFHAFTGDEEGHIHVFISEKSKNLLCEIIDDGIGIDKTELSTLFLSKTSKHKHFTGIGIKNVDDRIKLLYGDKYGVSIKSKPNVGTTVSIVLPIIL
ncbi:sensor histidine kinase [Clostridium guangxiense]|uniref:sensor histidine kinase n=1 Tax=Clostridium guangxiense TaxID=1662055 RepID=UPI001E2B0438|nr:sensor histidine kinase [Clostridium guangxiense]MCD2347767.1 sensor histidine kinase [Clostridium guangxiense]